MRMVTLSKREFEKRYAAMKETTVKEIHKRGWKAERCNCGADYCYGWMMVEVTPKLRKRKIVND